MKMIITTQSLMTFYNTTYLPCIPSKDVRLPTQLQRAMAAEAEAARDARAKVRLCHVRLCHVR